MAKAASSRRPSTRRPYRALLTGAALAALAALLSPAAVQARPDAYIADEASNTVSVIDTATNASVGTVAVGTDPKAVAISPNGNRAYVVNESSNDVTVIDAATRAVAATVGIGTAPNGIAIAPNGSRAYVTKPASGALSVLDTASNTVVATPAVGTIPGDAAVAPDGSRVYIANAGSGNVSVLDVATNTVVATIGVGTGPSAIAVTPDGSRVYIANAISNDVSVVDTSTGTVVATIGAGTTPSAIAIAPNGSRAYVTNEDSNDVAVIDTATNTVVATIGLGTKPSAVAVNPGGGRVYVASEDAGSVFVIDTASNAVVSTIGGIASPSAVAIVPDQPPLASLSAVPGRRDSPTTFDAVGSTDPDGMIARYDWDFGDGTGAQNGGPTQSHTYEKAGNYAATVTETDEVGCSTTLIFTGQTASCNGSPVARKSVDVTISKYRPRWRFSILSNRRGRTADVRFGLSGEDLDLREATLLLPRGFRMSLGGVPRCRAGESASAASTARRRCRASLRLGQLYFSYPRSKKVIRRNIYLSGKGKLTAVSSTKGRGGRNPELANRTPQVNGIHVARGSGKLTVGLGIRTSTKIRRVGIHLWGERFGWLKYTNALAATRKVCARLRVSTHAQGSRTAFSQRRCRRQKTVT